jgi:hypothetical protein
MRIPGSWFLVLSFLVLCACKVPDPPPVGTGFTDDFERKELGGNYLPTSPRYRIDKGILKVDKAENHPLWLRKKLPDKAVIEFDAWSETDAGDIKVEFFGDGESFATSRTGQYTASGYVAVFGGWNNTKSILARGNEHGMSLSQRSDKKVEAGRRYHWKIEKNGENLTWYIDDMAEPFLKLEDKRPLPKGDHYFGFANWQAGSGFDNLVIRPL